jgi:tetratricopeptide (TPR) repeat protein
LTRAANLFEQLAAEQPDDNDHQRARLACYRGLAAVAGDDGQQLASWEKVLALAEELCRLNPDDDLVRPTDLAQAHHLLAGFLSTGPRNHFGEAEPHYQQAIELMERVIAKYPNRFGCRSQLADSLGNLGLLYFRTGRTAQAEKSFRRADALLDELMREDPNHLIYSLSRAAVAMNWGSLAVSAGRPKEVVSRCERAVGWSETVFRAEPNMAMARSMVFNARGNLALACENAGRFKEALPHWDRVIDLATGSDRLNYQLRRINARIKAGDHSKAEVEADALVAGSNCPPDVIYNCACVFALAGRVEKAVALLNKLRSEGYFEKVDNLKNLRTDTDFDSL